MKSKHILCGVCVLLSSLCAAAAAAATDQVDISVALKTLPLLTNRMESPVDVVALYDPDNTQSKADAEQIKSAIDGGIEVPGDMKLQARLVSTLDLSGLALAKIAFLAQGLPASDYKSVAAAAAKAGVLTISADIDCAKNNSCVLGVVTRPGIQIYYSPAAAEAARISFATAFTLLVKQVGGM